MIPAAGFADDLPVPLLSVNRDNFRVSWINHSAQEHFGISLKSAAGKTLPELFVGGESLEDACQKVNENFAPVTIHDFAARHRSGTNRACDLIVFPSGELLGISVQYQEMARRDVEADGFAMSAMGRMLAHEIKNPLAGINGAAQLLRDDIDSAEGLDLVNLIESEIGRIQRLTERMERLGDVDPDMHQQINIHEVLQQARKIMEPALPAYVRITEHYDPSVPELCGDPDTLMQVMINLIKNSAEAIENGEVGDEIRLETAFVSGLRQRGPMGQSIAHLPISVKVSDNGPGIEPAMQENLFKPFTSSKPTGQGLGLALVSKVAAAHNAHVEVERKDGWTCFSLFLPLSGDQFAEGEHDEI